MSKVSVLVAVYNGERYLRETLDSLLGQTLSDIQIVCINDASTDSTAEILQEYKEKDERILVLTQTENTGQAVARNHGIAHCTGDYITMVDADDLLSADALERAVEKLDSDRKLDCVLFDLKYLSEDGSLQDYPKHAEGSEWSGFDAFRLSLDWTLHGLYVARAELYRKFPFDATCRLYSDDNTTRLHYLNSVRVARCSGEYHYRQHAGSMTNSDSIRRFDLLEANTSMSAQISGQPFDVRMAFEKERWINMVGLYGYWLEHRQMLTFEESQNVLERIRTVYRTVDRLFLPISLKFKFGYMPLSGFLTFRIQANLYFLLRRFTGK